MAMAQLLEHDVPKRVGVMPGFRTQGESNDDALTKEHTTPGGDGGPAMTPELREAFMQLFSVPLDGSEITPAAADDQRGRHPIQWKQLAARQGVAVKEVPKALAYQQALWLDVLTSERDHIRQLHATLRLYRDQLLQKSPPILHEPEELARRVFAGLGGLLDAHYGHFYAPLRALWISRGAWTSFDAAAFHRLLDALEEPLLRYSAGYLRAVRTVALEAAGNWKFRTFLVHQQSGSLLRRENYEVLLRLPVARLFVYAHSLKLLAEAASKSAVGPRGDGGGDDDDDDAHVPVHAIYHHLHDSFKPYVDAINEVADRTNRLRIMCETAIDQSRQRAAEIDLAARLRPRLLTSAADAELFEVLDVEGPGRKILFRITCFCRISTIARADVVNERRWSWYELYAFEDYIAVTEQFAWTAPDEPSRENDAESALGLTRLINPRSIEFVHGGKEKQAVRKNRFRLLRAGTEGRRAGRWTLRMRYVCLPSTGTVTGREEMLLTADDKGDLVTLMASMANLKKLSSGRLASSSCPPGTDSGGGGGHASSGWETSDSGR